MLKKILLLCIFLCTSLLLSACTRQTKEEITFSSWGSVTEVKILKNIINDFEKENPNVKVVFIHIPQNYFQKLHLLFASKTPPDVLFINNLYLPVYSSHLENLSDIINPQDFYTQTLETMTYDGKLCAIPRDISNQLIYVNADILGKNHLQTPNSEWTLEDMLSLAKQVSHDNIFGISYSPELYWALPYINYFGENIQDIAQNVFDYGINQSQGLVMYKSLVQNKIAPTKSDVGSSTLAQMFIDGKLCFYMSGRWMYPKISETAKFDWSVINFPYGKKGVPADSSGWAISKTSKHKNTAQKFVLFLSNKKNSEIFTQTDLIVPARKNNANLLYNDKHNEKVFIDVIKNSEKNITNKNYNKMSDKINKLLEL